MPGHVDACLGFLELLVKTYRLSPRTARSLLVDSTSTQVLCITEVILNTLEGNLTISNRPQQELARFKTVLRKVPRILATIPLAKIATTPVTSTGVATGQLATDASATETAGHSVSLNSATAVNSTNSSIRTINNISSKSSGSNLPKKVNNKNNRPLKTSAASRTKLRELYVKHYKTIVEFLERCIAQLRHLIGE